ncbi:MAG TPA: YcxB family protein [Aquabacterium sp.]|uniref:YcxB family protein n=1 Tax=Aquabacterium sp. TaxID=1872578 RepID=UPI002E37D47A|nr:YcxB family protein [Aquabacterium sp.]HEX5373132.1 YcxB family protein [Aquabacterium sp.]
MIRFSLTYTDFQRFQKLVAYRFQRQKGALSLQFGMRVLIWLCIGIACATYARLFREWPEISGPLTVIGVAGALALILAAIQPQLSQALLRKHLLLSNGAFLSPQVISFNSDGLRVETQRGKTETPWSGFLDRDEDDTNYYLFIDAMQAVIVPRAALGDQLAQFVQFTRNITRQ